MRKSILFLTFVFMVLFTSNVVGQSQEEIDQRSVENSIAEIGNSDAEMPFDPSMLKKAQQALSGMAYLNDEHVMSASSDIVYSKNPAILSVFKGTIWSIEYTAINTYTDTFFFSDSVFVGDDGVASLRFTDNIGRSGLLMYVVSGAENLAEVANVSPQFFYASTNSPSYDKLMMILFNMNGANNIAGSYRLTTFNALDWYPMTGIKIQGSPGPNDLDDDGDGYTENQGDCNDNSRFIYPGAIEVCGDGIDQDCNGSDLSCLNEDPPSAPKGVTASDGTLSGMVQVSWNPSAGAESYDIYRADIPAWAGGVPKRIATSITGTSYDDTSAVSGKQYYYWVKAKNINGGSGYSMFDPGYWGARGYVPSVPNNAAASDGTVSIMVTVTWTAVPNSVVYEIYRADYPAYLGGNIRNIGTSTTTSYNDATVANGNQYYYWVKARNSWGVSGYSKFDTGYIGASSPLLPAPTGVAATDGGSSKVTLTWNAVSGALIYEVYRASKPAYEGGVPTLMGTVKNPTLIYNDTAITSGPTFYYWVKARNSWGSSGYSKFDTGYCTGP